MVARVLVGRDGEDGEIGKAGNEHGNIKGEGRGQEALREEGR